MKLALLLQINVILVPKLKIEVKMHQIVYVYLVSMMKIAQNFIVQPVLQDVINAKVQPNVLFAKKIPTEN